MPSSNNPKQRVKQTVGASRFVDTKGHLEVWFASDSPTKSFDNIDKVCELLEYQGLINFLV